MSIEQDVRRALRWHSAGWRDTHADAFVGLYLDRADDEGWSRLPARERRTIHREGLRERARWHGPAFLGIVAIASGFAALALAPLPNWIAPVAWVIVGPLALALGVVALLVAGEGRSSPRSVTTAVLAAASASLLSASWWIAVYRDVTLASGGYIPTTAFWALSGAYVLTMCATTSVAGSKPLESLGMPSALSVVTSLLGGVMCAALFAAIALVPALQVLSGTALATLSLVGQRRTQRQRYRRGDLHTC